MGVVEDVRSVVQDLLAPALKSQAVLIESAAKESKLRDEMLAAKIDSLDRESRARDEALAREARNREEMMLSRMEMLSAKMEAISAKMDYQYASITSALNLDKRMEALERHKQTASA